MQIYVFQTLKELVNCVCAFSRKQRAKEIIKEVWLKRKVEKKKYFICAHYLCSSKREKKTNKEGRELA